MIIVCQNRILEEKAETATKLCEKLFISCGNNHNHANGKQANITTNLTQFESYGIKTRGTAALQNTLNWLKAKYLSYGYTAAQIEEDPFTYSGSSTVCKNLVVTKIQILRHFCSAQKDTMQNFTPITTSSSSDYYPVHQRGSL